MDSSFFNLDEDANIFKRLKSRDVIKYVIGFHAERVANLEAALDASRVKRSALNESIAGLGRALREVGVGSAEELLNRIGEVQKRAEKLQSDLADVKTGRKEYTTHATEALEQQSESAGRCAFHNRSINY